MIKVIIEIGTFSLESSFLCENTSTETFAEANLEFWAADSHFHIWLLREEFDQFVFLV